MNKRQKYILAALVVGSGTVFLDGTIVNLALPSVAHTLNASFSGLQWVMAGYLLALSAFLLIGGSLGDIYGYKRIYLLGITGFTIASVLCAISPSIGWLIIFRIIQGVFAALVVPGALAIINTNFSDTLRAKAIGVWVGGTSIIGAIGPVIAGFLIGKASWRWVFILEIPFLIICTGLAHFSISNTITKSGRHLDLGGAALAMLSLTGIIFGLIKGTANGWSIAPIIALALSLALFWLFIKNEQSSHSPMLNLKLFNSKDFSSVNFITFLLYGGLNGFFFIFIIHLQTVVGLSSAITGLVTIPVAIIIGVFASRFGKLATKHGPRVFMTIGPIIIGLSLLSMLQLHSGSSFLKDLLPRLLLLGTGIAINVAPLTDVVIGSVKKENSGIASAINNTVARTAGLIVVALLGVFGTQNAYKFGGLLCGTMAIIAGLASWMLVSSKNVAENPVIPG